MLEPYNFMLFHVAVFSKSIFLVALVYDALSIIHWNMICNTHKEVKDWISECDVIPLIWRVLTMCFLFYLLFLYHKMFSKVSINIAHMLNDKRDQFIYLSLTDFKIYLSISFITLIVFIF